MPARISFYGGTSQIPLLTPVFVKIAVCHNINWIPIAGSLTSDSPTTVLFCGTIQKLCSWF